MKPQLLEQPSDVLLHRRHADPERVRDLLVRSALGDQHRHVQLALGQPRDRALCRHRCHCGPRLGSSVPDLHGLALCPVPLREAMHGIPQSALEQRRLHLSLDQVGRRPEPHRLQVDLVVAVAGHHDHWDLEAPLDGEAHEIQSAVLSHAVIHDADVRPVLDHGGEAGLEGRGPAEVERAGGDLG